MAKLIYKDEEGKGDDLEIELGERSTLGRHPDQSVQILDRVVSKQHAVIVRLFDGTHELTDMGSRNGTYLNGEKLGHSSPLIDGDEIRIGTTVLTYREGDQGSSVRNYVSIEEGPAEGAIYTSEARESLIGDFLPEEEIRDEKVLRRDYERLRIGHKLSRTICLGTDRDLILGRILDTVFEFVDADRVLVMLRRDIAERTSPGGDEGASHELGEGTGVGLGVQGSVELVPVLMRASNHQDSLETVKVSRTILSQVLKDRQAVRSEDALSDSRFNHSHSVVFDRIRSTMTVPLMSGQEVLGVIHLDSKSALGVFSEKDLAILMGLARQVSLVLEHNLLLRQVEEEIVKRENLYRFLPPQIVKDVLSGNLDFERGSQKKYVTVMFADIRGFTRMSESLEPEELVIQLNDYFEQMVEVVFRHGGTLDKLIGDEIMAVWGAPIEVEEGAKCAVMCAFEMREVLVESNRERELKGLATIEVGFGINSGDVVAGFMGPLAALDYTVTGDTVNVAARLCDKAMGNQILVGQQTWNEVREIVEGEHLADKRLKGKNEQVNMYDVRGVRSKSEEMKEADEIEIEGRWLR